MTEKILKDDDLKACENCSYWYNDGFCMQHCHYTEDSYYCPKWTDEDIEFDYNRIYYLCKQYIEICHMFEKTEHLQKKSPEKHLEWSFQNEQFFLNCCLNDLAREMSLWKTRK